MLPISMRHTNETLYFQYRVKNCIKFELIQHNSLGQW
uniref:Uncharacterized protein n=1 Tax=Ciona intestinalis TaxID=7719 RepID=H2XRC7_CIOIN